MRKPRRRSYSDPLARPFAARLYLTPLEKRVLREEALRAFPRAANGKPRYGLAATALIRFAWEYVQESVRAEESMRRVAARNSGGCLQIKKRSVKP